MKLIKGLLTKFLVAIITLSILATTSFAAGEYTVYRDISVYTNANDAKYRTNSAGVYDAGQYYIYKSYGGMLNISRTSGTAGAWINPEDNILAQRFVTVGSSVNIRSQAQIGNNIVGKNKLGDIIEGTLLNSGWIIFEHNGKIAYTIANLYVNEIDLSERYVKNSVNIRSSSNSSSRILGVLRANSVVKGVRVGNWFKFIYKDSVGYIYMGLTHRVPSSVDLTLSNTMEREVRLPVNIREENNLSSYVVYTAQPGSIIHGVKEGDWFKFIHENNYVYAHYPYTQALENDRLENIYGEIEYITNNTVNVRYSASSSSTKMGTLKKDFNLNGVMEGNWIKFIYNGEIAYIYSSLADKVYKEDAEILTRLEGISVANEEQMVKYLLKTNPNISEKFLNLAKVYLKEGAIEGIRGDLAFAQSLLETGNFSFGGDVKESQNNFAGIGATGGGNLGESFATPEIGVRAQIQHLKAYANTKPLVQKNVDPRFHYVVRGNAPYLEWLSIQKNPLGYGWAWNANYGELILGILDRILEY